MTFPTTWFIVTIGSASYALYRLQHHLNDRQRRLLTPLIYLGEIIDLILCLCLFFAYRALYGREEQEGGVVEDGEADSAPNDDPLLARLDGLPRHEPPDGEPTTSPPFKVEIGAPARLKFDDRGRLN